jgi:hypothetical protein
MACIQNSYCTYSTSLFSKANVVQRFTTSPHWDVSYSLMLYRLNQSSRWDVQYARSFYDDSSDTHAASILFFKFEYLDILFLMESKRGQGVPCWEYHCFMRLCPIWANGGSLER